MTCGRFALRPGPARGRSRQWMRGRSERRRSAFLCFQPGLQIEAFGQDRFPAFEALFAWRLAGENDLDLELDLLDSAICRFPLGLR